MPGRLRTAALLLFGVLAVGTAGYSVIEGWRFLDSLYMTVITIATVGYREVGPLSDGGRVFTMALIFAGVGGIAYSFGTILDFMMEGHLTTLLEDRRMLKRISNLTGHHIVVGIGRVGSVVATTLANEGTPFVIIDTSDEARAASAEAGWLFVLGDATEEHVLIEAGIERAKGLVTAVDTDADNLFISLTARTLNPELYIVARSSSVTSEAKILRSGADRVITPNFIGGRRMAAMMLHPVVSDYLDIVTHGDGIEFRLDSAAISATSKLTGTSIKNARIRDVTGAYILAIRTADGVINANPPANTILQAGDELVMLGTSDQLTALAALL